MTVIAGQAAPGSLVTVLIDGADVQTETADGRGEFVALLSLPPSEAARVLTLRATLGEQSALSGDEIILAPTAAPAPAQAAEQVASARPQDGTVPETAPAAQSKTAAAATGAEATAEEASETPAETTAGTAGARPEQAATEPVPDTQAAEAQSTGQDAGQAASGTPAPAAPAPVAVLRSDAQGVELVQPATPAPDIAPQQVVLDTIGYAEDGAVLLSGRAEPGATIRVYLDNAPVSDLSTAGDGRWRGTLGAVAPGIYTLRLDALDGAGAVISRLETPFKREAPEVLAEAQARIAAQTPPPAPQVSRVTVQAGDTLWAISRERYGDGLLYVRVFDANRDSIRNPDLIYPGQVFTLPD
ncbi:MAG: LysM peptidoglycan-binding domain-containing protein [Rhodobacteraceae bacterium]|nr:MAG: LysM peptidoglycan-binding domain-containing protein [Paracoccaceae bacterium]